MTLAEAMAPIYMNLIKNKLMTIDQVPAFYLPTVKSLINPNSAASSVVK